MILDNVNQDVKHTLDFASIGAGSMALMVNAIPLLTFITLVLGIGWYGIRFFEWWELRKRNQMRKIRDETRDEHD